MTQGLIELRTLWNIDQPCKIDNHFGHYKVLQRLWNTYWPCVILPEMRSLYGLVDFVQHPPALCDFTRPVKTYQACALCMVL